MSEPSSLYARITLTRSSFESFLSSPLNAAASYDDWLPWLASKSFHGQITNADIQNLVAQEGKSVGEYLSLLLESPYASPCKSDYDETPNIWMLRILPLSENYLDFIEILAILRSIKMYKDLPGEDFILIYPFLWGGELEAYIRIQEGKSTIESTVPAVLIEEANSRLRQLYEEFANPSE